MQHQLGTGGLAGMTLAVGSLTAKALVVEVKLKKVGSKMVGGTFPTVTQKAFGPYTVVAFQDSGHH